MTNVTRYIGQRSMLQGSRPPMMAACENKSVIQKKVILMMIY
jgi:hypothetical protein